MDSVTGIERLVADLSSAPLFSGAVSVTFAEEHGESEMLVFCSMHVGVKQGLNHPLHYKTMLQTANAANNHRPVHSLQLSNAFLMDSGSSIFFFF